jgi:hypothetical protein
MRLLGFDLRLPIDDATFSTWTPERRAGFLVDPTVRWPLSVDAVTWPQAPTVSEPSPLNLRAQVPRPPDRGGACESASVKIQIDLMSERSREEEASAVPAWWAPQSLSLADGLKPEHVGFDVADLWLLSGLTNCLVAPTDLERLKEKFIHRLTRFGLLSDPGDADEFARAVDSLVPEHRPFYVYGISLLR